MSDWNEDVRNQLRLLAECEDTQVAQKIVDSIQAAVNEKKDISSLLNFYLTNGSSRLFLLFSSIKESLIPDFFLKLKDQFSPNMPSDKLDLIISLLNHLFTEKPEWLPKLFVCKNLFDVLLSHLLVISNPASMIASTILVSTIFLLLPFHPHYITKQNIHHLCSIVAAYCKRVDYRQVNDDLTVILAFRVSLFSLVQRLYSLFPAEFVEYFKQTEPQVKLAIKPFLRWFRFNPDVIDRKDQPDADRWRGKEQQDILAHCAVWCLDHEEVSSDQPLILHCPFRDIGEILRHNGISVSFKNIMQSISLLSVPSQRQQTLVDSSRSNGDLRTSSSFHRSIESETAMDQCNCDRLLENVLKLHEQRGVRTGDHKSDVQKMAAVDRFLQDSAYSSDMSNHETESEPLARYPYGNNETRSLPVFHTKEVPIRRNSTDSDRAAFLIEEIDAVRQVTETTFYLDTAANCPRGQPSTFHLGPPAGPHPRPSEESQPNTKSVVNIDHALRSALWLPVSPSNDTLLALTPYRELDRVIQTDWDYYRQNVARHLVMSGPSVSWSHFGPESDSLKAPIPHDEVQVWRSRLMSLFHLLKYERQKRQMYASRNRKFLQERVRFEEERFNTILKSPAHCKEVVDTRDQAIQVDLTEQQQQQQQQQQHAKAASWSAGQSSGASVHGANRGGGGGRPLESCHSNPTTSEHAASKHDRQFVGQLEEMRVERDFYRRMYHKTAEKVISLRNELFSINQTLLTKSDEVHLPSIFADAEEHARCLKEAEFQRKENDKISRSCVEMKQRHEKLAHENTHLKEDCHKVKAENRKLVEEKQQCMVKMEAMESELESLRELRQTESQIVVALESRCLQLMQELLISQQSSIQTSPH